MLGDLVRRSSVPAVDREVRSAGGSFPNPFLALGQYPSGSAIDHLRALRASDNTIVGSAIATRGLVFSEARLRFQRFDDGRPGDFFGSPALRVLENPWPGASTGDLLAWMDLDASVYGNSYWTPSSDRQSLLRLPPERTIVAYVPIVDDASGVIFSARILGYIVTPHSAPHLDPLGLGTIAWPDGAFFSVDRVAHYRPLADPHYWFRGRSWVSLVLADAEADNGLNSYKTKYVENAATSNLAIKFDASVDPEEIEKYADIFEASHQGVDRAFKTMYLGGGADIQSLGANFEQLAMKATQGGGETRIALASGVPAAILGISEGLAGSALNAGNYTAARRRFADGTLRPLWRAACAALQTLVPPPDGGSRLWYDDRDIPFLQEDVLDAAQINAQHAAAMRQLVDAGYEPTTVRDAITSGDLKRLVHTGNVSVQLQPAGSIGAAPPQE